MNPAIQISNLGKLYKLYNKPINKVFDVFGVNRMMFWRKDNYQEFWALRDLDLEVMKGERLGIVGRNGAGKSTLLKIISGNVSPTEGSVQVNGSVQALMELGTGFHPDFSGRENIKASLSYNNISLKRIKSLEEEIIDFTELEEFIDQPVKVYSAGMYARLAFAVATVLEPEILIVDEILGAGDASFAMKSSQRMKRLTEETGATVLFVSHSMESVIEMCDHAILLNRGRITHDSDPLTISKVYNSMIRAEDEILIRAKESKLRKKDYRALHAISDSSTPLLFRLKAENDHPKSVHLFSKFSISNAGDVICEIDAGAPMDNDLASPNRIIDGIGLMDWGNPIKQGGSFFRPYQNENGLYSHAPFQLCIPSYLNDGSDLILQIEAKIAKEEKIYLEFWKKDKYIKLLEFNATESIFTISLKDYLTNASSSNEELTTNDIQHAKIESDSEVGNNEMNKYEFELLKEDLSVYGTQELVISKVDVLDHVQRSKRVFYVGEELKFELTFSSTSIIPSFFIVASILLTDGRPMTQVYCDSKDLGLINFQGETTLHLSFSPLRFGQGEYMVSFGAFKEYNLTTEKEDESYCVLDRAVFFKIQQPEGMHKGLGFNAHSCIWSHNQNQYTYDPTTHYSTILEGATK